MADQQPGAAIAKAFVAMQKALSTAKKTSTNPHFNSKFADYAETASVAREAMDANGLAFRHKIFNATDGVSVTCVLIHESGETIEDEPLIVFLAQKSAQAQGSAVSYGKRYTLQAMCGIASEDDDGNAATGASDKVPPVRGAAALKAKAVDTIVNALGINRETGEVSRPFAPITIGFGSAKGQTSEQLDEKSLAWYGKVYAESVADPAKASFKEANELALEVLRKEREWRKANGAA